MDIRECLELDKKYVFCIATCKKICNNARNKLQRQNTEILLLLLFSRSISRWPGTLSFQRHTHIFFFPKIINHSVSG